MASSNTTTESKEEESANDFQVFSAQEVNGKLHSFLKVPRVLPTRIDTSEGVVSPKDIFNIVMADCSGSMSSAWPHVVKGWEDHIKENLSGVTKIFVFGSEVTFRREGSALVKEDFLGGGTNITGALKVLREEVDNCVGSIVRVFIITDGEHVFGEPFPETEIIQMAPPVGKTVSVYLLGIGNGFPVTYSIDIRSHLHNGNANVPSLYWAKDLEDIEMQLSYIGNDLNSALITLHLNIEGYVLPGLDKSSSFHLGEWLYFEEAPDALPTLQFNFNEGKMEMIPMTVKPVTVKHLLDAVFRQWNSILIQQHRKKAHVPLETFDLMESLFNHLMNEIKSNAPIGNDVKARLSKKNITSYEIEFKTLKNRGKNLIDVESKFSNELELADNILKSTITNTKYDIKNLKLKGHGMPEFERDLQLFKDTYKKHKSAILSLSAPLPEECCCVTISSTLTDLQDPNFELLLQENKFELLKSFTITGIPIYAPVRDSSQINPWTLSIKNVLVTPYSILSQQILELSASVDEASIGNTDGDVFLQKDDEKTRFNAIVPIIPARAVHVLKPIIISNIYAMLATFSILKNPHIIDYNAHIAALGCVWMKTVRQFPQHKRPEFAKDRLESIVETAKVYMNRPTITRYIDVLLNDPKQALMTESSEEYDGKNLKCEALIKPAFYAYLTKEKFTHQQTTNLLKLMLFEFLGRCLSSIRPEEGGDTLFTDLFCEELADPEKRTQLLNKHCKVLLDSYQAGDGELLKKFFTIDDLQPDLKKYAYDKVVNIAGRLLNEVTIASNMNKIKKLRNFASCGDIWWLSFQNWAEEMGLSKEVIDDAFGPEQVAIYLHEAVRNTSSKDRLAKDLPEVGASYESIYEAITKRVDQENQRTLRTIILKAVEDFSVKKWRELYMDIHRPLVMPMSREEIIQVAQSRGISVTQDTFFKVYRYTERLGLLRNACQIPGCPHFLQPHNNFNQHLAVEREEENFPHALHLVTNSFNQCDVEGIISEVASGKHSGTKQRKHPPPPEPAALQPLADEIKTLIEIYSANAITES